MKTHMFALLGILSTLLGCTTPTRLSQETANVNTPIQVAIADFSTTSLIYKQYKVFHISQWDFLKKDNVSVITVSAKDNKFLFTKDCIVGSKGKLPSKFIELNGKLFFWWDDEYALTGNMLNILKKYDLLQDDDNGRIRMVESINDDSRKGVHYYFCKDAPHTFKKVTTNTGLGYYEPPKLNCR